MNLADYDYTLPTELIAQMPAETRDGSRLMVVDTVTGTISHRRFTDIGDYLEERDLIAVNDTRVFPARLIGTRQPSGGVMEIFLLRPSGDNCWDALSRPSRRVKPGMTVMFGDGLLTAIVEEKGEHGHVRVRLVSDIPVEEAVDRVGRTPLPPYIKRDAVNSDRDRYQTVYAMNRGSVAAPTAGLHFSDAVIDGIRARGIPLATVTLHVGIGTFRPLTDEDAAGDTLHEEYCLVTAETADLIRDRRAGGGRVFTVGTTTARALETASRTGFIAPYEGWTDIFIKPGYRFNTVDCLVTNFHLPRSSLLVMVSAFAGRDIVMTAYEEAVRERYRFYSYGDAMLILR